VVTFQSNIVVLGGQVKSDVVMLLQAHLLIFSYFFYIFSGADTPKIINPFLMTAHGQLPKPILLQLSFSQNR
jgi:hypothetical protein